MLLPPRSAALKPWRIYVPSVARRSTTSMAEVMSELTPTFQQLGGLLPGTVFLGIGTLLLRTFIRDSAITQSILKTEVASIRHVSKAEVKATRNAIRTELAEVRVSLIESKSELEKQVSQLQADVATLKAEICRMRNDIYTTRSVPSSLHENNHFNNGVSFSTLPQES
mmetsp:Transcript_11621/g.17341  ORF Transcript_11621/g.17341 Transcript_11621/m.17341 type:complete len:168 (-) Transcript_11621:275-778(-)